MVGRDGFEPSTNWLKATCSTAELTARSLRHTRVCSEGAYSLSAPMTMVASDRRGVLDPRRYEFPHGAGSYHTARRQAQPPKPDSTTP